MVPNALKQYETTVTDYQTDENLHERVTKMQMEGCHTLPFPLCNDK